MPPVARSTLVVSLLAGLFLLLGASPRELRGEEQGNLVIMGGGVRYDQPAIWSRIVTLAGGEKPLIAVFPTASSEPLANGSHSADALRAAGADAFLVPLYLEKGEVDYRQLVADREMVERVRAARGVYFTGGSQERITAALGSHQGDRTPMLEAIWDVYRSGGVIAGTSAGAAVMSRMMFSRPHSVLKTLEDGVQVGVEVAPGLGFLAADWFVDQHCLVRGRFGRSLVAMQTLGFKHGVGVDENTAVVVERGNAMSVVGESGAIVLDLSAAAADPNVKGFNVKNARLTYLSDGDAFDLETLKPTPAPPKQADTMIDPNSAEFKPGRDDVLVSNNILARDARRAGLQADRQQAARGDRPGLRSVAARYRQRAGLRVPLLPRRR